MKTITSRSGSVHLVDDRPTRYPTRIGTACGFNIKGKLDPDERTVDCQYCAAFVAHGDALKSQMDRLVQEEKKLFISDLASGIGTTEEDVVNAAMCIPHVWWASSTDHSRFVMAKTQQQPPQQEIK